MEDQNDTLTIDAFGKKRRGRPPTGNALSGAERQRRYREKRAVAFSVGSVADARVVELEAVVAALRDENNKLQSDNLLLRELADRQILENRELGRVISALKSGKRPKDLAAKGWFASDKKRNSNVKGEKHDG